MCRFVAYIGKKSVVLSDVLEKPSNSLIQQSRHAKQLALPVNADGFGIAWYKHNIDSSPGIFKSTQPAWNDLNLLHISNLIDSKCFIGHVRASTVGNVSNFNCHPFAYRKYAFCHNGDIRNFAKIKRDLCASLSDELYQKIMGQTDSEHFFAYLMNIHLKTKRLNSFSEFVNSFQKAVKGILDLQNAANVEKYALLNTVITDGKQLMATRFTTNKDNALSLYYTVGHHIDTDCNSPVMEFDTKNPTAVLIASEPLGDFAKNWVEVPINTALIVNHKLEITSKNLDSDICN